MTGDSILVYTTSTPADIARERITTDAQTAAAQVIERNDNNES